MTTNQIISQINSGKRITFDQLQHLQRRAVKMRRDTLAAEGAIVKCMASGVIKDGAWMPDPKKVEI